MLVKVDLMSRAEHVEDGAAESLSIGAVARLSGKAPSSIRYYEEVGLLDEPERIGGRRRYPRTVLRRLAVIGTPPLMPSAGRCTSIRTSARR